MTLIISERQREILESSSRILTTLGVSGLTIKNIAKEMGFSESALYKHFVSKEEIIVALLEYLAQNMNERYSSSIFDGQTTEEKFRTLFQSQFSFFQHNPHFVVAVFSDGLLEENKRINETIMKVISIKMKYLRPIIEEGQQNGVFINSISLDALLHIVIATFRHQMFKWRLANFQFDLQLSGEIIIQSLLTLIKTKV